MKKIIFTENAPAAIGPYSQAVAIGNLVYTSGQIAMDAITGDLVDGSVAEEAHQVMKNLAAILKQSNADFSTVIKTSIFLTSMDDFSIVNEVYASYFTDDEFPARETIQVSRLPKNVNVEISMIAHIKS